MSPSTGQDEPEPTPARPTPAVPAPSALLDGVLDALDAFVYVKDTDGRFLLANPALAAFFGRPVAEIVGRTDADFHPPEAVAAIRANDQAVIATGRALVAEEGTRVDGANGPEWRTFLSRKTPLRDAEGGVVGIVGVTTDITERVRAEAGLRASEARFRALFDQTPFSTVVYDADGRLVDSNPAAARVWGATAADARPDYVVWDDPQLAATGVLPLLRRAYDGEAVATPPTRYDTAPTRADGGAAGTARARWVQAALFPVRDDAGVVRQVVAVHEDVTERMAAEAAAHASERRLRRLFEANVVGVIFADTSGRILDANDAFLTLLGYPRSQLAAGALRWDAITPPGWDAADRQIAADLLASGVSAPVEKEYLAADGRAVPVLVGGALLDDSDLSDGQLGHGDPVAVVYVVDLSEQKRAEDEVRRLAAGLERQVEERTRDLRAANARLAAGTRQKSEFLAHMSHELRTPLNAIQGFCELLVDGVVGPVTPEQRECLTDVLNGSRHLVRLVNEVLDVAKVEAGQVTLRPEPVDVAALVDEVVRALRAVTATAGVEVRADVEPGAAHLVTDPGRLRQVLYNYLANALKFTPAGGQVTVRAAPRALPAGPGVRFEVADTGVGIAADDVARLFTEFAQVGAGAGWHPDGTGLGLAFTRRIVEAQGGAVGVASTPGAGSTFWAELPDRARDYAGPPGVTSGASDASGATGSAANPAPR